MLTSGVVPGLLARIHSCITQLKAQGPSRTCSESKSEREEGVASVGVGVELSLTSAAVSSAAVVVSEPGGAVVRVAIVETSSSSLTVETTAADVSTVASGRPCKE